MKSGSLKRISAEISLPSQMVSRKNRSEFGHVRKGFRGTCGVTKRFSDPIILRKFWFRRNKRDRVIKKGYHSNYLDSKTIWRNSFRMFDGSYLLLAIPICSSLKWEVTSKTFCHWEETPEWILYSVIRFWSDDYGDDSTGDEYIVYPDAPILCDCYSGNEQIENNFKTGEEKCTKAYFIERK